MITDDVPDIPKTRVFDPTRHGFNPLKDLDYKGARELAAVPYVISPQGENTLTVRNGKRALLQALLQTKKTAKWKGKTEKRAFTRFDQITGDEEVTGMISDILASPLLRRVLCEPSDFHFNPKFKIIARINRAELGEFDSLVLGLLLMSHYKGQLVIPDFGFYGRDVHTNLIREGRLIAGVNYLSELPDKLRKAALLIPDKIPSGATFEDAVVLANYLEKNPPHTDGYDTFIKAAMRG